ncbi:MAG: DUF4132 domain-containing protein [Candidatus Eremiobacterota bacterium]
MLADATQKLFLTALAEHRPKAARNRLDLPSDREALRFLEEGSRVEMGAPRSHLDLPLKGFHPFLAQPDVTPLHVVRLLFLLEGFSHMGGTWLNVTRSGSQVLDAYRHAHPDFGLTELSEALQQLKLPERMLLRELVQNAHLQGWEPERVLPFVLGHRDVLAAILSGKPPSPDLSVAPDSLLALVERAGELPSPLFEAALERALEGKKISPRFQKVLGSDPRLVAALLEALRSRSAPRRTEAARWLAALKVPVAREALAAQLGCEKNEKVRVELQRALGAAPTSRAEGAAAAELPFPLPPGAAPALIATALKLASTDSWPELDAHLASLSPLARRSLGSSLLTAWLEDPEKRLGLTAPLAFCLEAGDVPLLMQFLEDWGGKRLKLSHAVLAVASRMQAPEGAFLLLHALFRSPQAKVRRQAGVELTRAAGSASVDDWVDARIPHAGELSEDRILDLYGERLYWCMLLGREWSADFWRQHLVGHPVVGKLCHSLVWQQGERALAAGEVVAGSAPVRVAHAVTLSGGAALPGAPFQQFPEGAVALTEAEKRHKRLPDLAGLELEDRVLWKAVSRLGYQRDQVDDPRWYHALRKRLVGLDVDAYLLVPKGVGCPESGQRVTLGDLLFATQDRYGELKARVLGSLPEVLVAEFRRELKAALQGVAPRL